jgi:hypothetical protein
MLNELYTAERALRRFHVRIEESHPWVKHLGKSEILVASLDGTGAVVEFERMPAAEAAGLFKIQKSNHANFPQVNWSCPVWKLDEASPVVQEWRACPAEDTARRAGLLAKVCEGSEFFGGHDAALARVQSFCRELAPRFSTDAGEFEAFPALLRRMAGFSLSADEWVRRMSEAAVRSAAAGSADLLKLVERLLTEYDPKKDLKVPILFDLADRAEFRCRIASARMGGYYSRRLNATATGSGDEGRCGLSGATMPLVRDKTPSPRLPVLGDAVIMAMNPDTPCQTRYGRTGMDVFPLGERTAADLDAALKHLTSPSREGKNWKRVPASVSGKWHLLLVYLENDPDLEAEIAEVFSGSEAAERTYESICKEVCNALEARPANESGLLRLFVLNKIDPGRVQVELSGSFTAADAVQGSNEWIEGAANRPLLCFKDDAPAPSPFGAMRCTQTQWERGGASSADAPGCRLAEVYDLLIAGREGTRQSAQHLLRLVLERADGLLVGVGDAAHRGDKKVWKRLGRDATKQAALAASLLGIALMKLEERKERYMTDAAFLMGRFLSLADTLHVQYCKEVRKGDTPPQLLGNSLIPTAIQDPSKGLARMLERIRIYQGWARTRGTPLARWSCAEMGKVAADLAERLPRGRRFDDTEQAQLLLGYLARTESSEESNDKQGEAN